MKIRSEKIEPTWGMALQLWWWVFWRSLLTVIVIGFLLGFIIGLLLGIMGLDVNEYKLLFNIIGFFLGFMINIYFFKKVLGRKFKNYTLATINNIEEEENSTKDDIQNP